MAGFSEPGQRGTAQARVRESLLSTPGRRRRNKPRGSAACCAEGLSPFRTFRLRIKLFGFSHLPESRRLSAQQAAEPHGPAASDFFTPALSDLIAACLA